MKTNLLAQNDNLVIENLKADVGKSVMDLSHSVTFPINPDGAILPICCLETLPSDSFEISVECLLRQLTPLKVPLMTNLRLNTAFYYCDNRLGWKKWDRFMTGGRSGNELYDIPRCANAFSYDIVEDEVTNLRFDLFDSLNYYDVTEGVQLNPKIKLSNTLHTYFGISLNHNGTTIGELSVDYSKELPVAFPFFDYQMICRDYYTNVDRLKEQETNFQDFEDIDGDWCYKNLFPSDEDEIKLIDGPQHKSGFHTDDDLISQNYTVGFVLDKVRYHDVRPDYFTTSKKAPMRGDAPALTAVTSNLKLPSGTTINLNNKVFSGGIFQDFQNVQHGGPDIQQQFNSSVIPGETSTPLYMTVDRPVGPEAPKGTPYTAFDIGGVFTTNQDIAVTGNVSTDFTAADIRLLSQLTVWQELNMLHEPYYNDFLNAHFDGVRVGESPVEKPQYIGGTSQLISINEILQTSQSTETSPLGNQGATAMSLASNFVGRYYCNNYGFIIGVAYIVPDMVYNPAMPRVFSRRTKEDYYSPEFANLSMQATLNKEIFFSNDSEWNNSPWGYTGAFDELRSIPNRIAGDLLNSSYTDLQKWVLTRNFSNDNKPAMSHKFLCLKDNVDYTAWSVQSMPKFMLQCANYIKAVRPMPKVAIPKAL